jgi:hypothetical protein
MSSPPSSGVRERLGEKGGQARTMHAALVACATPRCVRLRRHAIPATQVRTSCMQKPAFMLTRGPRPPPLPPIREGTSTWEDLNLDDVDVRLKFAGLFHRGKRTPQRFMMRLKV